MGIGVTEPEVRILKMLDGVWLKAMTKDDDNG